ncbi:MAG: TrkH family potassium uptake protein, partial [Lentisphaeria bacterium]
MRTHLVIRIISLLMVVVGLALSTSIIVSWVMNDSLECILEMALATAISIFLPLIIYFKVNKNYHHEPIGFREGFAIVTLGWIFASVISAIPFCIVGKTSFIDGFFESISGFTTTGSSILNNIEQLPKGLLYWRAMTHWLGGMGIVVLSLAILPVLGVGGQQLFKAEVPGPISDQLTPRIADSAKILWGVYVLLTGLESLCLRIAGMTWFDAICHSMATMATGGFSTKQASIEFYHTPAFANGVYIDTIITVFMFLAGCNFILHLSALRGKLFSYFRDEEFRCYLWIIIFSIVTLTIFLFINGT